VLFFKIVFNAKNHKMKKLSVFIMAAALAGLFELAAAQNDNSTATHKAVIGQGDRVIAKNDTLPPKKKSKKNKKDTTVMPNPTPAPSPNPPNQPAPTPTPNPNPSPNPPAPNQQVNPPATPPTPNPTTTPSPTTPKPPGH
jgi:hypothetical protein